uniref:Uncharacterized protein LOC111126817 n=1 Tax=Crassostrea virginica TaxID=6565 RepID=A0A8B8DI99_CRAVI|nr:uncharacterized protein LOC111126817 [Crassostrea virginica]
MSTTNEVTTPSTTIAIPVSSVETTKTPTSTAVSQASVTTATSEIHTTLVSTTSMRNTATTAAVTSTSQSSKLSETSTTTTTQMSTGKNSFATQDILTTESTLTKTSGTEQTTNSVQTSYVTSTTSLSPSTLSKSLTTTTAERSSIPPQAKCGSKTVSYPDFNSITSSIDNDLGKMYLLDEAIFALTCCGRISQWEVEHSSSGYIELMVWRPLADGNYKFAGANSILLIGASTTNFTVLDDERIAVMSGDLIGWRCSNENLVTFKRCAGIQGCPTNSRKAASLDNLTPGTLFNWSAHATIESGMAYAVKFTLEENTPISFPMYNISVKDHIAVGGYVTNLGLQGVDFREDVSYQILPDPFDTNETWTYFSVDSKGVIRTARPLLPSYYLSSYPLIVSAEDSCDNSASISLAITTQNWPPLIHSLPNSISINEDTPPNYVIYTTEVTDLYGDPVCCTLSDTHPQTFNFNITNDPPGSSTYQFITTRTARFSYEDFNSYLVYMCCDDTRNRAQGILMVNIKKPVKTLPYTPPKWFFTSIIAAMVPITVISFTGCSLLCYTMFGTD